MANVHGGLHFVRGQRVEMPSLPKAAATLPVLLTTHGPPQVSLGQQVEAGQVLTRTQTTAQTACQAIHTTHCTSPLQGVVKEIYEGANASYHVAITPTQAIAPTALDLEPPKDRLLVSWLNAMRLAGHWSCKDGYVGLIAQLAAATKKRPDTVVCLAIDPFPPYPYLSSLMTRFANDMIQGTQLISEMVQAKRSILATSACKFTRRSANPHIKKSAVTMACIPDHYPIANTTLAVELLVPNRKIPYQTNPVDQGVIVISPWTAIRLGRWLKYKKLDLVVPMFIGWPEAEIPMAMTYAWPGQPIAALHTRLTAAIDKQIMKIIVGDPMTGHSLAGHANPAVLVDELLLTLCDFQPRPAPSPCIACGYCIEVCPTRLNPIGLYERCLKQTNAKNKTQLKYELTNCIACGLCSHLCPAALPLTQTFKQISEAANESFI